MKKSQEIKSYRKIFNEYNQNTLVNKIVISSIKSEYDRNHKTNNKQIYSVLKKSKIICPYCNSTKYKKSGFTINNQQRYKCLECNKKFIVSHKSLFHSSKVPLKTWALFLEGLLSESSIKTAVLKSKITLPTAYYWLNKIFICLKTYQNELNVGNRFFADETYIQATKNEVQVKSNNQEYRGISRNKMCICLLFDHNVLVAKYTGKGKPTSEIYFENMSKHIKANSTIIHDGEAAHNLLIKSLNLKEEFYKAKLSNGKTNQESLEKLEPINKECSYLKFFLDKHRGFKKDRLQDWLNLYVYIVNHKTVDSNPYFVTSSLLNKLAKCKEIVKYHKK